MSKLVKITIRPNAKGISKARELKEATMIYPEPCYAGGVRHLVTGGGNLEAGDDVCYSIALLRPDADVERILAHIDVEEISVDQANQLAIDWGKATMKVDDEVLVNAITAKMNAKIELTPEEQKAIDPNDEAPGIRKFNIKRFLPIKEQ